MTTFADGRFLCVSDPFYLQNSKNDKKQKKMTKIKFMKVKFRKNGAIYRIYQDRHPQKRAYLGVQKWSKITEEFGILCYKSMDNSIFVFFALF